MFSMLDKSFGVFIMILLWNKLIYNLIVKLLHPPLLVLGIKQIKVGVLIL